MHYQLGVSPDVGRDRFTVVPQIPSGQYKVAGRDIRVGTGLVNVTALRGNSRLVDDRPAGPASRCSRSAPCCPTGKHVKAVTVDGRKASFRVLSTARGREVRVNGGREVGRTVLVVTLR